jgi:hypothetical protein
LQKFTVFSGMPEPLTPTFKVEATKWGFLVPRLSAASAVTVKPLEPNSPDSNEDATFINIEGFSKSEWHGISYLRYAPTSVYFAHDLFLDTIVEPLQGGRRP